MEVIQKTKKFSVSGRMMSNTVSNVVWQTVPERQRMLRKILGILKL